MIYLQTILKRDDKELTKRVYRAQQNEPSPGDFALLVKSDFDLIEEEMNEENIQRMSKNSFKVFIKNKINVAAFNYLKKQKEKHSKLSKVKYKKLKTQKYMLSHVFSNEEVDILHALRSRSIDCKNNFKHKYTNGDLACLLCKQACDDQ